MLLKAINLNIGGKINMLSIINAQIITPVGILEKGFVTIKEGLITAVTAGDFKGVSSANNAVVDAQGLFLSPGFIDIHVHGGGGADFMDNEVDAYLQIAKTHAQFGTTSLLPTTLTSDTESLLTTFEVYQQAQLLNKQQGASFLGLHLEGPYFAMAQRGAQDPRYIRNPNPQEYEYILAHYKSIIARWSAAPELPGALAFARRLREEGIIAALGHTDAVYEEVLAGLENGFNLATHLYSGMSGMTRKNAYRYAGAIESCLLIDAIDVELIADGIHLPEPFLKLICKVKPADSIILITDAMRAAGTTATKSILGSTKDGVEVVIEGGVAKLPDRSSFAGSVATADRLIRTMMQAAAISLPQAIKMLTSNPARVLGRQHEIGAIAEGMQADLVLFDKDIIIQRTMVAGKWIFER